MKPRIEPIAIEQAVRLGADMGVKETQASKCAFRTLGQHPDLVRHVYGLLHQLLIRNKLDTRLRELAIMRIAWNIGCEYAWFQHFRHAVQVGITPEEIVAVRDWRNSTLFSPAERAVLAAVDDTRAHGDISDEVWAECERHLKDPVLLVELVAAIGNWTMMSQVLKTLRVQIEEGAAAWPPDGKGPKG